MKTFDLSSNNMSELTVKESVAVDGGNPWIAWCVTYVLITALTNPQAHLDALVKGFKEGYAAMSVDQ